MTIEELERAKKDLYIDYVKSKDQLIRKFVFYNDPYAIGDRFTDHVGTIVIETKKIGFNENIPCAIYHGTELKKDGSPKKSGNKRHAWQSNDISVKK